jgi:hypothetical protein
MFRRNVKGICLGVTSRGAKEAEEQANNVRDHSAKEGFLEIACQYPEMAEQAERQSW